ncbi:MAG TPA: hypothetical protein VNT60_08720, partial [Deinococcales bacterium]|nr:hypothetical protein [Deinococcales bacterium]
MEVVIASRVTSKRGGSYVTVRAILKRVGGGRAEVGAGAAWLRWTAAFRGRKSSGGIAAHSPATRVVRRRTRSSP